MTGVAHGNKIADLTFRGGHDLHYVPSSELDGQFKAAWRRQHPPSHQRPDDLLPWDDHHVTGTVSQLDLDQLTIHWSDGTAWKQPERQSWFRFFRLEISQTTAVSRER